MIVVATLFWQANEHSKDFSSMYSEAWVEKLYRGFRRNLTVPFEFICYTDRERQFSEQVSQRRINSPVPSYADCIQPYELDRPMILVGLDTVVTGNCDELAEYCMKADTIALPRDPLKPVRSCNGVALVPGGQKAIYDNWAGENDMEWLRSRPHRFIDDIFPGKVRSYRVQVKPEGLGDTRIVYFHGREKPHEIDAPEITRHWV